MTLGTTATGAVDPLPEILKLREKYKFRVHADAAYGGYFSLVDNLEPDAQLFAASGTGDSIAIDPHKHGLQPYGCGCILFKDPGVGKLVRTQFSVYVFHFERVAPRRNQSGVLAAGCGGGGVLGDAEVLAVGEGRRVRERTGEESKRGTGFLFALEE